MTTKDDSEKPKGNIYQATMNQVTNPAVLVVDSLGRMWEGTTYLLESLEDGEAKVAKKLQHGKKEVPVYIIDKEVWTSKKKTKPTPNACVYNATKEYMEAMRLGTLTSGDKTWFNEHPHTESSGVGAGFALSVIHGLVVPWGAGISRVWVPKNSALTEDQRRFLGALGCNPLGVLDHATSNDEFVEAMGFSAEDARSILGMCRFEFADYPEKPCIVLSAYGSTSAPAKANNGNVVVYGVNVSGEMGHATVAGPRDFIGGDNWQIACRVDELDKINYLNGALDGLDGYEPQEATEIKELSLFACTIGGVVPSKVPARTKAVTYNQSSFVGGRVGSSNIDDDKFPRVEQSAEGLMCLSCGSSYIGVVVFNEKADGTGYFCWECSETGKDRFKSPVLSTEEIASSDSAGASGKCDNCALLDCQNCDVFKALINESIKSGDSGTGHGLVSERVCRTCEIKLTIDEINYPLYCSECRQIEISVGDVCPLCSTTLTGFICDNCGFNDFQFIRSNDSCGEHPGSAVYEYITTMTGQIFVVCAECAWRSGLNEVDEITSDLCNIGGKDDSKVLHETARP